MDGTEDTAPSVTKHAETAISTAAQPASAASADILMTDPTPAEAVTAGTGDGEGIDQAMRADALAEGISAGKPMDLASKASEQPCADATPVPAEVSEASGKISEASAVDKSTSGLVLDGPTPHGSRSNKEQPDALLPMDAEQAAKAPGDFLKSCLREAADGKASAMTILEKLYAASLEVPGAEENAGGGTQERILVELASCFAQDGVPDQAECDYTGEVVVRGGRYVREGFGVYSHFELKDNGEMLLEYVYLGEFADNEEKGFGVTVYMQGENDAETMTIGAQHKNKRRGDSRVWFQGGCDHVKALSAPTEGVASLCYYDDEDQEFYAPKSGAKVCAVNFYEIDGSIQHVPIKTTPHFAAAEAAALQAISAARAANSTKAKAKLTGFKEIVIFEDTAFYPGSRVRLVKHPAHTGKTGTVKHINAQAATVIIPGTGEFKVDLGCLEDLEVLPEHSASGGKGTKRQAKNTAESPSSGKKAKVVEERAAARRKPGSAKPQEEPDEELEEPRLQLLTDRGDARELMQKVYTAVQPKVQGKLGCLAPGHHLVHKSRCFRSEAAELDMSGSEYSGEVKVHNGRYVRDGYGVYSEYLLNNDGEAELQYVYYGEFVENEEKGFGITLFMVGEEDKETMLVGSHGRNSNPCLWYNQGCERKRQPLQPEGADSLFYWDEDDHELYLPVAGDKGMAAMFYVQSHSIVHREVTPANKKHWDLVEAAVQMAAAAANIAVARQWEAASAGAFHPKLYDQPAFGMGSKVRIVGHPVHGGKTGAVTALTNRNYSILLDETSEEIKVSKYHLESLDVLPEHSITSVATGTVAPAVTNVPGKGAEETSPVPQPKRRGRPPMNKAVVTPSGTSSGTPSSQPAKRRRSAEMKDVYSFPAEGEDEEEEEQQATMEAPEERDVRKLASASKLDAELEAWLRDCPGSLPLLGAHLKTSGTLPSGRRLEKILEAPSALRMRACEPEHLVLLESAPKAALKKLAESMDRKREPYKLAAMDVPPALLEGTLGKGDKQQMQQLVTWWQSLHEAEGIQTDTKTAFASQVGSFLATSGMAADTLMSLPAELLLEHSTLSASEVTELIRWHQAAPRWAVTWLKEAATEDVQGLLAMPKQLLQLLQDKRSKERHLEELVSWKKDAGESTLLAVVAFMANRPVHELHALLEVPPEHRYQISKAIKSEADVDGAAAAMEKLLMWQRVNTKLLLALAESVGAGEVALHSLLNVSEKFVKVVSSQNEVTKVLAWERQSPASIKLAVELGQNSDLKMWIAAPLTLLCAAKQEKHFRVLSAWLKTGKEGVLAAEALPEEKAAALLDLPASILRYLDSKDTLLTFMVRRAPLCTARASLGCFLNHSMRMMPNET
ncbi:hypothetical protein CYMTET_51071 [Cymbomonas tetramitiformis]|uniref:Uncharacterized protein n=1 Tax=Cymbomonas tetramitiformis TaxID=36881 RepID=A0AAE0ESI8_9CHLO|nr:hypothetical protein CYMTET_51071 [Cymbomonas tetramitiformis]